MLYQAAVRNGGLERQVHFTGSVDLAAADTISIHCMDVSLFVVETYLTRVACFSFCNLGHNFSVIKGSCGKCSVGFYLRFMRLPGLVKYLEMENSLGACTLFSLAPGV